MPFTPRLQEEYVKYRLCVISRFVLAIGGGYLFTALMTTFIALSVPMNKVDAVLFSMSISILVYSIYFIWAFYIRSLRTGWFSSSALFALLYFAIIHLSEVQ